VSLFSCELLQKVGSASVPLPSVRAKEVFDSLAENFKVRFNDFRSHAINVRNFETPFPVEVSDVPEKLQIELTEMQYDSFLRSNY